MSLQKRNAAFKKCLLPANSPNLHLCCCHRKCAIKTAANWFISNKVFHTKYKRETLHTQRLLCKLQIHFHLWLYYVCILQMSMNFVEHECHSNDTNPQKSCDITVAKVHLITKRMSSKILCLQSGKQL